MDLRGYGDSECPTAGGECRDEGEGRSRLAHPRPPRTSGPRSRAPGTGSTASWWWGTIVCGALLAGADAPRVSSLTQFALVFRLSGAVVARFELDDPPAPHRRATREEVAERWNEQIPGDHATHRGGGPDDPVFDAF